MVIFHLRVLGGLKYAGGYLLRFILHNVALEALEVMKILTPIFERQTIKQKLDVYAIAIEIFGIQVEDEVVL